MPQSYRSLIYLWSAVLSISVVGAATLHAFGPVSPRDPAPERVAAPAAASIRPIAATAPWIAEAEPADEPPAIDLASPSPAVLTAGITEVRKLPPATVAPAAAPRPLAAALNPPAAVRSQPVMAAVAPPEPAQAPRAVAPAPARRPAPPMEAALAYRLPAQGYASYAPTGYIGVYTRSPDGMRLFQLYP